MKPINIFDDLKGNTYPGRGIVIGQSEDGKSIVTAYFIMGRSINSRNRIFVAEGENMRTQAHDPALLTDPSLVIYYPVRTFDGGLIVTNGDQTDTIRDHILVGHCYRHALNTRTFEPDGPNYTPRISGVVKPNGSYDLSILKSLDGDPACACRYFFEYEAPRAGVGHFIHTYERDGSPLPSFEGEPRRVALTAPDAETLAGDLWLALNSDNRVSLFVRYIDLETGDDETSIINKHW